MTTLAADPFEQMIRDAGEAWLIDWYDPAPEALSHLRAVLSDAQEAARKRFGDDAPEISPEALAVAYARNPHKVKAFLQAVGTLKSPDMLVMVLRVLQGSAISSVHLEYQPPKPFLLRVALTTTNSQPAEVYQSGEIEDAAVLRHFATFKRDQQGLFDGFYALRK